MIKNLLNSGDFAKLMTALTNGQKLSFSEEGLTMNLYYANGSIIIEGVYEQATEQAFQEFQTYVDSLPDDLFIEVCELIGEGTLKKINDSIASQDIEAIRSGTLMFKTLTNQIINQKIKTLKEYIRK